MSNLLATRRKTRFTQIANSCLKDKRISFKAKGLMAYFMSHSETWMFRESKIISDSTDGRDSVRAGIKELIQFGYLQKRQIRKNGKFSHIDYFIDDEVFYEDNPDSIDGKPDDGKPDDGKPDDGKPDDGNSPTNNTKYNNTNFKNTNSKSKQAQKEFFKFVNSLRRVLAPKNNQHPTLAVGKLLLGLNNKNLLYDMHTQRVLDANEAEQVYKHVYKHYNGRGYSTKVDLFFTA